MKRILPAKAAVSRHSLFLLRIGFCIILTEILLITLNLFSGDYPSHLYAVRLYRGMLEYIMLDLTVTVAGAFLLDLAARDRETS